MSVEFLVTTLVIVATRHRAAHGRGDHGTRSSAAPECSGLLYMAWATLKERGALVVEEETAPRSASEVILSGILVNILNPKLTMFFFAFLPQFVSTNEAHAFWRMMELSGVFMLATFVVFSAYEVSAASVRTQVVSRPRVMTTWMRRTLAGSCAALGARLALTDR